MSLTYAAFEPQTQEDGAGGSPGRSAIGVKVQLTAASSFTAMSADMYKAWAACRREWGGQPMFIQVGELWLANAGLNLDHATSAPFLTEFSQASGSPPVTDPPLRWPASARSR